MMNIFDIIDVQANKLLPSSIEAVESDATQRFQALTDDARTMLSTSEMTTRGAALHLQNKVKDDCQRIWNSLDCFNATVRDMTTGPASGQLLECFRSYIDDAVQRSLLTLDILRERGDVFLIHEVAGCPRSSPTSMRS